MADGSAKTPSVVQAEDISKLAECLAQSELEEAYELIDTVEAIPAVISNLIDQPTTPPSIYIDLEGVKLSREGSISILQIHIAPRKSRILSTFMSSAPRHSTPLAIWATL